MFFLQLFGLWLRPLFHDLVGFLLLLKSCQKSWTYHKRLLRSSSFRSVVVAMSFGIRRRANYKRSCSYLARRGFRYMAHWGLCRELLKLRKCIECGIFLHLHFLDIERQLLLLIFNDETCLRSSPTFTCNFSSSSLGRFLKQDILLLSSLGHSILNWPWLPTMFLLKVSELDVRHALPVKIMRPNIFFKRREVRSVFFRKIIEIHQVMLVSNPNQTLLKYIKPTSE